MAMASDGEHYSFIRLGREERKRTYSEQASAKGPWLPHKHPDKTERVKWACLPGPQRGQTRGVLYATGKDTTSALQKDR